MDKLQHLYNRWKTIMPELYRIISFWDIILIDIVIQNINWKLWFFFFLQSFWICLTIFLLNSQVIVINQIQIIGKILYQLTVQNNLQRNKQEQMIWLLIFYLISEIKNSFIFVWNPYSWIWLLQINCANENNKNHTIISLNYK